MTLTKSDKVRTRRRGRPAVGNGLTVGVRLQPADLECLDQWIASNAPGESRPGGLRKILRLVMLGRPES